MPIYETSSDPSHPTSRCCSFCIKPHSNAIQSPPPRKNQTYQPYPPRKTIRTNSTHLLTPLSLPQKRNVHHFHPHFSPIALNLGHLHAQTPPLSPLFRGTNAPL